MIPGRKPPKCGEVLVSITLKETRKIKHDCAKSKLKHPGLQYDNYFKETEENEEGWSKLVHGLVHICIHSLKKINSSQKKLSERIYWCVLGIAKTTKKQRKIESKSSGGCDGTLT